MLLFFVAVTASVFLGGTSLSVGTAEMRVVVFLCCAANYLCRKLHLYVCTISTKLLHASRLRP
ncbi:hypothetical protein C0Q70_17717 [Pomacea canaliculata]|uniref:Secreted protein n=1 Tax=Pomacea canaliculata TaxID=400727 RepID=A0A2T7NL70_POMCA|nr:hypothetical protein C0Q70_17717 [Pomacea canaliculata]